MLLCGTIVVPQRMPSLASRTVSARAGRINYLIGVAYLDEKRVVIKPGLPPQMKNGQQLRIKNGKAELLLGLGVYLRLGDASVIRMQETQLDDIRVSVENGPALIEIEQMSKGSRLRVMCGAAATELRRDGLYRFDTAMDGALSDTLRIYKGDAAVDGEAGSIIGKKGQLVNLAGSLNLHNFDLKESDSLQLWALRRSQQRIDAERRRLEARRMQQARQDLFLEEQHQNR